MRQDRTREGCEALSVSRGTNGVPTVVVKGKRLISRQQPVGRSRSVEGMAG